MITFIEKEVKLEDVDTLEKLTLTNRTKEYVADLEEELKEKEDWDVDTKHCEVIRLFFFLDVQAHWLPSNKGNRKVEINSKMDHL